MQRPFACMYFNVVQSLDNMQDNNALGPKNLLKKHDLQIPFKINLLCTLKMYVLLSSMNLTE